MTRMDLSRFARRLLPRNDTLFFEDEDSREMYVLLTGSLGVYRDEVQVATIDLPLSVVGEVSALTGRPRIATVRGLEPCTLAVVPDPDELFAQYPLLGAKVARTLASRLQAMNERFVRLKQTCAERRGPAAVAAASALPAAVPTVPAVPAAAAAPDVGDAADAVARARAIEETLVAFADLLDWEPAADATS